MPALKANKEKTMLRVAINGYGRIGRNIVRTLFERGLHNKVKLSPLTIWAMHAPGSSHLF